MLMIDLHLFALNCNESFRIVVDEKEKRAKLCCLTLSILVFYVKCFIIGTFIKYYKISQLIHTQSIAN